VEDLVSLRTELSLYNRLLTEKPWVIVANKIDLEAAELNLKRIEQRFPKVTILPVSGNQGTGIEEFRDRLRSMVES